MYSLLESFGYFIIFICVFIECGVLLGLVLPLPGFSLLFTAGVFAAADKLSLTGIIAIGLLAAVSGYIVGYATGAKYGRSLFYERDNQKYFTRKQGLAAEKFMNRWGYSTMVVGRYLPILHTVVPILNGMAKTPLVPFMIANVLGGLLWVCSATFLGYFLGQSMPNAYYYVIPVVILGGIIANTPFVQRYVSRTLIKIEKM